MVLNLGVSKDGRTQFWSCPIKTCNGRAHSPINTENLHVVTEHNHAKVQNQHVVRERNEIIKQTALANPGLAPRELNMQARAGLSDEQLMQMPSSSAVQRRVELLREIPERRQVDAKLLVDIIIAVKVEVKYITIHAFIGRICR